MCCFTKTLQINSMNRLLSLFFFVWTAFSVTAQDGYTIESYHVDIIIQDNGEVKVIEKIDVNFTEKRRGIFRNIPTRYDIQGEIKTIALTDIKVAKWDHKTTKEKDQTVIRIGNPDRYLTGPQSYEISYKVKDVIMPYAEHDEFYWNIIGTEWNAPIAQASFSIRFPYGWKEKIKEFTTFKGQERTNIDHVNLIKEDNLFTSDQGVSLFVGEGITVAFKLPKGLVPMKSPSKNDNNSDGIMVQDDRSKDWLSLIPAGMAMFLFGQWRKGGKRQEEPAEVPDEYYPPADISPAVVGTFYDYRVNRRDIISLIPYWGVKGFLRIKPIEGSEGDMYFEKLQEIPTSEPNYAIKFFNDLFEGSDHTLLSDLREKFYSKMNKASSAIMSEVKDRELYDLPSLKRYHSGWMIAIGVIIMLVGIPLAVIVKSIALSIATFILGTYCIVIHFLKPKLSDTGYDLHQYLRGFYQFLKKPNPEKLNQLITEDSQYLYKVFPYAMAFGLDKEWENFFKDWKVDAPDWYMYSVPMYGHHHTMGQFTKDFGAHKIEQVFYSAPAPDPSSSGGGFSGGGGSVGGGFGGGGGGSW